MGTGTPVSIGETITADKMNKKLENVEESDIAIGAITTSKMVDGIITIDKIADGAVTGTKFADSAIVSAKISSDVPQIPVGAIFAWAKSLSGVPPLPEGWVECNGQTIDDPESPLNGVTLPDLNSSNRFLRGNTSSGSTGGASTADHDHQIYPHSGTYGQSSGPTEYVVISMVSATTYTAPGIQPPFYDVVWIVKIK